MFEKTIEAIEPFALGTIIIAGASLASWIDFSNKRIVGIIVVGFGVLLVIKHIVTRVKAK